MSSEPRLFVVATPIGNLGDISARAIETLKTADAIACEDTRHTRKLLSALSITGKRLLAVHQHNESAAANGIVALLAKGEVVALVSDAGTPGVSDPGGAVIQAALDAGYPVEAIPGPAAFLVALTVSGFDTERFVYEGFLPRKGRSRDVALTELRDSARTSVFYESPNRVLATLDDLRSVCGEERLVSVSRELTKRFETTVRGPLREVIAKLGAEPTKGEYVVVVEGKPNQPQDSTDASAHDAESAVRERLASLLRAGTKTKDAAEIVASETGRSRKEIYAVALLVRSEVGSSS